MKLRMDPLDVQTNQAGKINALFWNGKRYRYLRALERWEWRGEWWTTPNLEGHRRRYYRVQVQNITSRSEALWEIYEQKGVWVLSRELD